MQQGNRNGKGDEELRGDGREGENGTRRREGEAEWRPRRTARAPTPRSDPVADVMVTAQSPFKGKKEKLEGKGIPSHMFIHSFIHSFLT